MLDFQADIRAFQDALPRLLERHEGEYAVIRDAEVLRETFPTYEQALDWAHDKYGLQRFYVKQISDKAHATHFLRGFAA